jgi:hypothetical protein
MRNVATKAVKERVEGRRPSRLRAALAAAAIGMAAAVLAFRLLRSRPAVADDGETSG